MAKALRPVIAGNWKMHGTLASARALAAAVRAGWRRPESRGRGGGLPAASASGGGGRGAGRRASGAGGAGLPRPASRGAYRDVSAAMLADCGCRFTIVGHSERRAEHHETDGVVRGKALAALEAGLLPILCVGESAARHAPPGGAEEVVVVQLAGSLPEAFCRRRRHHRL